MFIRAATLDDLLRRVFQRISKFGTRVPDSSRGSNTELRNVLLRLEDPRARLSHTEKKGRVFSALGEFAWYIAQSNDADFIEYYIPKYREEREDDGTIHGAYGPRIFADSWHNQFTRITKLLSEHPSTRKAMIQVFDAADLSGSFKDVPCTGSFQFLVRSNLLHMTVSMRSNDAFKGLPHDVFCFTMIQEILARTLGCEVGDYSHFATSLHLYDEDEMLAGKYVDEGWQGTIGAQMPPMES